MKAPLKRPKHSVHPLAKDSGRDFSQQVGKTALRKLRAQRHVNKTLWRGLGMMGLVGWAIAIPTMFGALAGMWFDAQYPSRYSWTLMLLVVGVCLGCFTAWRWVAQEHHEINHYEESDDAH